MLFEGEIERALDFRAIAASFAAVFASWWALFGWDLRKYRGSDGYAHGPLQAWQFIAFAVIVVVIGVWAGRRRSGLAAAVAVAIALTLGNEISIAIAVSLPNTAPGAGVPLIPASFLAVWTVASLVEYASRAGDWRTRSGRR